MKIKINVYQVIAVVIAVIGIFFAYLAAELDDAPGVLIIGSAVVIGATSMLYGLGEMIKKTNDNNTLLIELLKNEKDK